MSLVAALLLASATQAAPAVQRDGPDRGAQVETAQISVTILRPAMVTRGVLVSGGNPDSPHSQRQSAGGHISYVFE